MDEGIYIKRFRWIALVSGLVLALLLVTAWIRETFMPDWKKYQSEYRALAHERSQEEVSVMETGSQIYRVSPKGLNRTDRGDKDHPCSELPQVRWI